MCCQSSFEHGLSATSTHLHGRTGQLDFIVNSSNQSQWVLCKFFECCNSCNIRAKSTHNMRRIQFWAIELLYDGPLKEQSCVFTCHQVLPKYRVHSLLRLHNTWIHRTLCTHLLQSNAVAKQCSQFGMSFTAHEAADRMENMYLIAFSICSWLSGTSFDPSSQCL